MEVVAADAQASLAHAALRPLDDPIDALARLASEAGAWKDALAGRVNALLAIRYQADGPGTEQLRAEVALYERAMDRTARLCETLAKLNLGERAQALDERVAAQFEAVLRAVLADPELGLTPAQTRVAPGVVDRHLAVVG